MPRFRKIKKTLPNKQKNYYVVDASFLVRNYIPIEIITDERKKRELKIASNGGKKLINN